MQLVYENTTSPVQIGDIVHIKNTAYTVSQIIEPHKPSSTGRVVCIAEESLNTYTWFPNVIKAHWINRTDQPWSA
jgi:hypothetical protein